GEHATSSHGPALALYAARHPRTELLACCDLDPGKAERYRARFGFARAYTNLRRMLDTERPDAVSLVAPVERTCELACLILGWGFPLLMEKPPGRTIAEVDRMIAAAGGVAHQVAFNRRFAPLLRELKREVDAHVAPAQLAFCPTAGVVVERAVVHGRDHTFYAYVPMGDAFDAPGRLQHLEKGELKRDAKGSELADSPEPFVHGGFYGEYVAFLDALGAGRPPSPGLREARQSVAVAECIRERKGEYRA